MKRRIKKSTSLRPKQTWALLAETKHEIGAAIVMDEDDFEMHYTYYLQGNETRAAERPSDDHPRRG